MKTTNSITPSLLTLMRGSFARILIGGSCLAMTAKTTTLSTIAILAVAMNCSAQNCDSDPLAAVGTAMIVGGKDGGPSVISDNGRNAFVIGDGKGSGVIFQDRGATYIQKVGDTTFIVPTGNPPASQRNCQR